MPRVIRWKKYVKRGTRRSDNLQHSYSIALFALWLFPRLRKHVRFDEHFVLHALLLHDLGEGETGTDDHYIDKNKNSDAAEWGGFRKTYSKTLGPEASAAYLLQYVNKIPFMPRSIRRELSLIGRKRKTEQLVFEATERFDYLLYALEQYQKRGKKKILVQTLRNQLLHYERLHKQLPGFGKILWTPQLQSFCHRLLAQHDGKWIEQKSER